MSQTLKEDVLSAFDEYEMAKEFVGLLRVLANAQGTLSVGKINGVPWFFKSKDVAPLVGIIPTFLDQEDERPMKEQIDTAYVSGWREFKGHRLEDDWSLNYPGDPALHPVAACALHGAIFVMYEYGWALIMEPGGWEVCRLD